MRSERPMRRCRMFGRQAWPLFLCLAVCLAIVPLAGEAGSRSHSNVRQLSTPFKAKKQSRRRSIKAPRRVRNRSNRWKRARSPWSRARSRRMSTIPQIRSTRRRASRYGVDPDLLLRIPGPGAFNADDLRTLRMLGIPVIPGVPPIAILSPDDRDRDTAEAIIERGR